MKINVSIILLTKNAGKEFRKTLAKIFSQKYKSYEVILIDSSSTDNTLKLVKKYPVRIIRINAKEFSHGKTRNLGAKLAKGRYIVYLTQDAIPKDSDWITNLIKNFNDEKVVGVFGRQIPRKNSPPQDKFSYSEDYPNIKETLTLNNYKYKNVVFSDVNSAIRRNILMQYPFLDNLIIGEDLYWSPLVINEGYKIVYEPDAAVIHSHVYSLLKIFRLNFDVGVAYSQIPQNSNSKNLTRNSLGRFSKKIIHLIKSKKYLWVIIAFFTDLVRLLAIYLGQNHKLLPIYMKKYLSNYPNYWI